MSIFVGQDQVAGERCFGGPSESLDRVVFCFELAGQAVSVREILSVTLDYKWVLKQSGLMDKRTIHSKWLDETETSHKKW